MNPITQKVGQKVSSNWMRDCWVAVQEMDRDVAEQAEELQTLREGTALDDLRELIEEVWTELLQEEQDA